MSTPTPSQPIPDAEREAVALIPLQKIARDAAEAAGKNSKVAPELLFAPILWTLQDATLTTQAAHAEAERSVWNARATRAEERCEVLIAERDAALAREARLREALEPFAAVSRSNPNVAAKLTIWCVGQAICWGDFHTAAALASTSEPQPAAEGDS